MIYLIAARGSSAPKGYLTSWGRNLQSRFEIIAYEDVLDRKDLPVGTYIFTSMEFLGSLALRRAKELAHALGVKGNCRVVNDPGRHIGRFALLRSLHRQGVHRHNVYRPWSLHRITHFPVFIRSGHRHSGSLTPPLYTRSATVCALLNPRTVRRARGDLVIVEYVDTTGDDGLYHKYGAYRIGRAIVPHHVYRSRHWQIKGGLGEPIRSDPEAILENLRYIEQNPHREFVERIFEASGIEYGRLDYAITKDGPVAFEINNNPHIIYDENDGDIRWREPTRRFCALLTDALRELDSP